MINSLSSVALARQPVNQHIINGESSCESDPVAFIFISSVSPVFSIKNYLINNYELIEMQVFFAVQNC